MIEKDNRDTIGPYVIKFQNMIKYSVENTEDIMGRIKSAAKKDSEGEST